MSIASIEVANNNNISCKALTCGSVNSVQVNNGRLLNINNTNQLSDNDLPPQLSFYKSRNGEPVVLNDYVSQTYDIAMNDAKQYIVTGQEVSRVAASPSGGNVPVDRFYNSYGPNSLSQRLLMAHNNDFVIGSGSKSTTDNNGFVWIPSINGAPTGTPDVTRTGYAGLIFNHNNLRLYAWIPSLNAWKYCQFS